MRTIDRHPLTQDVYELGLAIEAMPASKAATAASVGTSNIGVAIHVLLDEMAALRARVAELEGDKAESEDRERRLNVMLSRTRAERSAILLAVTKAMEAAKARGERYTYLAASVAGGEIVSRRGDLIDLERELNCAIDAARQAEKETT